MSAGQKTVLEHEDEPEHEHDYCDTSLRDKRSGIPSGLSRRKPCARNFCPRLRCLDLSLEPVEVVGINFMSFLALSLNRPEMKLGEVLIPWIVVIGTFGFLAAWLVVAIMERTGLSRYVWHLPLFFLALVVLLSSVMGMLFQP
jgi:Protein of unknown function (DUF1656)